ncbi:hypothetical protein FLM9_723 [Candidatus Synechococcus spongiarum]|uniref:Uncharacterized protein n=1 Tax=Candidatus Synechococcus spongiarum TaxID=431041 RepID=A0A164Z4M5_9SYNE|nr:hypothetical protein FLM9_723 [Candidatus Synechococcus spongiarum]
MDLFLSPVAGVASSISSASLASAGASSSPAQRISVHSALGMLWLQLHFENCHWDSLAAGCVELEPDTLSEFLSDCSAAGVVCSSPLPPA